MKKYFLDDPKNAPLMCQKGVKHYDYPERHSHNAIWDSNAGPDGKFYYALASEIATSGYVRYCSFDYATGEAEELFAIEDVILPQERAIRASKFHTSICFMPDGRSIMTTHTTDKSPRHPTWMPYAYYHHLWEGFAGGNIVIYDPKTGRAENLGIPVPHESIYGSVYEPVHNALYFLGMFRGHLYKYSLDSKTVKDLGKTSENYSFRLSIGADGNIYGASRTGWLYRIDRSTDKVTDLNFQLSHAAMDYTTRYNNVSIGRIGPDGRLYMAGMYSRSLYALDTGAQSVEDMGWYLPAERYAACENRHGVFGMDFDSRGVLWYAVTSLNNFNGVRSYGIPASLFRWDIARGEKPEWCGLIGTETRGGAWISEVSISNDDILYIANSNHSLDGPSVIGIDLNVFEPYAMNGKLLDEYFDPKCPRYVESEQMILDQEEIMAANPCEVQLQCASPILLWRALAPHNPEDSCVKGLYWDADGTLYGVCGERDLFFFAIRDEKLEFIIPIDRASKEKAAAALNRELPTLDFMDALPFYPGRQYKAKPCAAVKLDCGTLLGTQDGLVALVKDGRVHGYGPAAINGPIHQMVATPDRKKAFGVAGDEQDIATLFSFDEVRGLRQLGFITKGAVGDIDDVFCCTVVRSIAMSPCGSYLALGADERLGTVVIYRI